MVIVTLCWGKFILNNLSIFLQFQVLSLWLFVARYYFNIFLKTLSLLVDFLSYFFFVVFLETLFYHFPFFWGVPIMERLLFYVTEGVSRQNKMLSSLVFLRTPLKFKILFLRGWIILETKNSFFNSYNKQTLWSGLINKISKLKTS